MTEMLTTIKGGGDLEKYLAVESLKPFINMDLVLEGMLAFRLPEVEGLERDILVLAGLLVCFELRGPDFFCPVASRPISTASLNGSLGRFGCFVAMPSI